MDGVTADSWADLDEPWREAFRQAWEALRTGNIAVGACASTPDGEIIYAARNRVCDSTGPAGEVFGSALAHAEINVLARLPFRRHRDLVLTTTLQPCLQCAAALRFGPIGTVRFAGADHYWDGCHEFGKLSVFEAERRQPARIGPLRGELATFAALMTRFGPAMTPEYEAILTRLGEGPMSDKAREMVRDGEVAQLVTLEVDEAISYLRPVLRALAA